MLFLLGLGLPFPKGKANEKTLASHGAFDREKTLAPKAAGFASTIGLWRARPLTPDPSAPRPHLVMWVVDDQGWANIGYHNPDNVLTPVADELAAAGVKLDRHYTYRWCAPTRSALLTGRLPYHVFQTTNHVDLDAVEALIMALTEFEGAYRITHRVGPNCPSC